MLPIRLPNLAVEAFGKYLSGILEKLVTQSRRTSIENFTKEILDPVCGELEEIITKFVPVALADEVTEKLMTDLLKTYSYLEKHNDYSKQSTETYENKIDFCKQVTVAICSAILHPSMKEFKFSRFQFPEVKYSEAKTFINYFISVILKKLGNIRCLMLEMQEFDENIFHENIKFLKNLEEFTFFGCTDGILEVLSDTCKNIKFIDLRNSEKVTVSSVESILKLKCLEYLNLKWTSIMPHGIEQLVYGLKSRNQISLLKDFQSMFLPYQINHIPVWFPNLISLELYVHEQYSLFPLKELKQLSHLGIYFSIVQSYSSVDFEELLKSLGSQLISLKLCQFRENKLTNVFRIIAENCTRIEDVILRGIPIPFTDEESARTEFENIPTLETIKHCELKGLNVHLVELVVTKCVNLKEITCWSRRTDLKSL
ncbi:hypothetical protein L9F63_016413 [Diploptera punctata]|uniref:Uncharacterized protein n=1 Tax=Diploptera punctata TaxID=6984 RepID=A0AAD8EHY2_DIPPU|nr:hypothetical protein L9F63_016413 [Diploptera punctata]